MTVGIRATNGCKSDPRCTAKVARVEAEVGMQVSRLDAKLGTATKANASLLTQLAAAFLLLDLQRDLMETCKKSFEELMDTLREKVLAMTEGFQERTRSLEGEIILLKQAMMQGTPSTSDPPPAKVRVPEPKPSDGAQNAKDLEKFLWDMEKYFIAARIPCW